MLQTSASPPWSLPRRFAFRFAFSYFAIAFLSAPLGGAWLFARLVPWVGRHVFGLASPVDLHPTGSGDTTAGYLTLFSAMVLSAGVTLLWSALDRRLSHPRLWDAFRVLLRYFLAFTMLGYASVKLLPSQFVLRPDRLLATYGESSPMGLLWTFMGASKAYTVFTGAIEATAAFLLMFPTTATAGALLNVAVLGNVVALNFCYDVPVKLFSSQLLLMSLLVLLPDVRPLGQLLFAGGGSATASCPLIPGLGRWRSRLRLVVIAVIVAIPVRSSWQAYRTWGAGAPRSALSGTYEVEELTLDGTPRPPLLTDPVRWRAVAVDADRVVVRHMDASLDVYAALEDVPHRRITLRQPWKSAESWVLEWDRPDSDHLVIAGNTAAGAIRARLRRLDDFRLTRRGFHWVSEAPFDR